MHGCKHASAEQPGAQSLILTSAVPRAGELGRNFSPIPHALRNLHHTASTKASGKDAEYAQGESRLGICIDPSPSEAAALQEAVSGAVHDAMQGAVDKARYPVRLQATSVAVRHCSSRRFAFKTAACEIAARTSRCRHLFL